MKKFSSLTASQKRVAVAKDVLKRIASKQIKPITGKYINFRGLQQFDENDDIKKNLPRVKNCQACAMGACLLSITSFQNNLKFGDVGYDISNLNNPKVKKLFRLFSAKQLLLIESAFEETDIFADRVADALFDYGTGNLTDETTDAVNAFARSYKTDTGRLKAIMNNIIKNKGEFILLSKEQKV